MRRAALLIVCILISPAFPFAQEPSLGDAAREARAEKSQSSHAVRVITDDDFHGSPVAATDDPIEVVNKARASLLRDSSHRCRQTSAGNSGPGWSQNMVIEVSGRGRVHIMVDENRPNGSHGEYILIDKDGFQRVGSGPWQKMIAAQTNLFQGVQLPGVLQFGYQPGDLKLIRRETISDVPVFLYQFRPNDIQRTISIWIGVNDNLPRKTEMSTFSKEMKTSWQESTSCSYGIAATIDPPM